MSGPQESAVERLRKQAERALASAQGRRVVEPILERILSVAPDGSDASVFAHRHLAEYRVEDHPWRALLHLRKVLGAHPDDDVVHALMGLSHALLAHFHSAVASYRRAIAAAPRNPWYHHNLGHLLDVALDMPGQALPHLQLAHRAAPEHEIAASLAHCLARLRRLGEAREIASGAVRAAPRSKEHKQLLAWIDSGAPDDRSSSPKGSGKREAPGKASTRGGAARPAVVKPSEGEPRADGQVREGRRRDGHLRDASTKEPQRGAGAAGAAKPTGRSPGSAGSGGAAGDGGAALGMPSMGTPSMGTPSMGTPSMGTPSMGTPSGGAASDGPGSGSGAAAAVGRARKSAPRPEPERSDAVHSLLERAMSEGGFSAQHVACAQRLWADYRVRAVPARRQRADRSARPGIDAAAIEYAIARIHGMPGVTRASIARRYGVSARSVSERFDDIQVVLELVPADPRYAG